MKKVFIFSTVALLMLAIFWLSYNLVFNEGDSSSALEQDGKSMKDLTGVGSDEVIKKISDLGVISPVVDETGKLVKYYDSEEKVLKTVVFDGSIEKKIEDKSLPTVSNLVWSTGKTEAIIQNGEGFFHYDQKNRESGKIKDNVDTVVWSSLSSKILYKYYDTKTKERSLNIANVDGSNWRKIADLDFKDVSITSIPQTSFVAFWNYPDYNVASTIKKISVVGEEESVLMSDKVGADYLFSPNGTKMLVSYTKAGTPNSVSLGVKDMDNGNYQELNVPTVVSKCTWSEDNKNIFCALPTSIGENVVMPNDYQSGKFLSKDTFWKIDVTTGEKKRVVELDEIMAEYDAMNLLLSPNEDILFFVNKYDKSLYRISI